MKKIKQNSEMPLYKKRRVEGDAMIVTYCKDLGLVFGFRAGQKVKW